MTNDSHQVTDAQTSEQRVRAVWPKTYHDYPGWCTRIRTGVYPNDVIGEGCDLPNAWDAACKHPSVVAYEALRRPKAVEVVRENLEDLMRDTVPAFSDPVAHREGGEKHTCDCWKHKDQVCDICQRVSPLTVTRDGVPCEDQKAALAEFLSRCNAYENPVAQDSGKGFEDWYSGKGWDPYFKEPAREVWNASLASRPAPEEKFNPEPFAEDVMTYAIKAASKFTFEQYTEAFRELCKAAEAEHQESLER